MKLNPYKIKIRNKRNSLKIFAFPLRKKEKELNYILRLFLKINIILFFTLKQITFSFFVHSSIHV